MTGFDGGERSPGLLRLVDLERRAVVDACCVVETKCCSFACVGVDVGAQETYCESPGCADVVSGCDVNDVVCVAVILIV